MLNRGFVQRVFQLGSVAFCKVDAVIVLFTQHIQKYGSLEPPESVTQRELVERVRFKFRHKLAV